MFQLSNQYNELLSFYKKMAENGYNRNDGTLISSKPDSSTISFPFYSPLDNDLAMERGAAKNILNVYMG